MPARSVRETSHLPLVITFTPCIDICYDSMTCVLLYMAGQDVLTQGSHNNKCTQVQFKVHGIQQCMWQICDSTRMLRYATSSHRDHACKLCAKVLIHYMRSRNNSLDGQSDYMVTLTSSFEQQQLAGRCITCIVRHCRAHNSFLACMR